MVSQSLLAIITGKILSANELSYKMNIIDNIHWLNKSVNLIKLDTVNKYSIKVGFNLVLD